MIDALYRSKNLVAELAGALTQAAENQPPMQIMHVCGTHEHEIGRHALRQLFPTNLRLIAGPGCPVCITPASAIVTAMHLAELPGNPILCTYGDIVHVPTRSGSLIEARGRGADIRLIYGPREALRLALENSNRPVIFFSVGFETTAAPVAGLLLSPLPKNFFIYTCHRYVPAAVEALASQDEGQIAGYLLPGHASVITGTVAYEFLPSRFGKAAAVAGFEPVDMLSAILSLVRQLKEGRPMVANCYPRAVAAMGNQKAQELLNRVFEINDAAWRGIGVLPKTGFALRKEFDAHNALVHFGLGEIPAEDLMPGCSCHLIMTGRRQPQECPLFGKKCTPDNPQGPCMVGGEGTCRARYLYPEEIYE